MGYNVGPALKKIAIKNSKNAAVEIVLEVLEPALQQVVADTSNPFDDVALAAIKEPMKKALLDMIAKIEE